MDDRRLHFWVGLLAVLGITASLFLAFKASTFQVSTQKGYQLIAYFSEVGGLTVRAPVTISGITVGRVAAIELDPDSFEAKVTININDATLQLPEDTSASILTAGLLGEKYLGLFPGGLDEVLVDQDIIGQTQSALILENLVSKFLFDANEE